MSRSSTREEGFALVVITALFVAFSLLAAAILDRSNATQQLILQNQTRAKISRISNALVQYYLFNGRRYPCPAAYDVDVTDAAFGASMTSCDSVDPTSGGEVLTQTGALTASATVRGMVPVVALAPYGVTPMDALDAWNNRIMYAVDRGMTVAAGAANATPTMRPLIADGTTTELTTADFVVVSYGKDGIGAIPRAQTYATVSCPSAYTSGREVNCDNSTTFVQYPPHTDPHYSNSTTDLTSYYDDLVASFAMGL